MHAERDLLAALRAQLNRAVARRRLPWRLLPLVPPLAALPVAPLGALPLYAAAIGWALWDIHAWRRRVARDWPRWLDDAVPALEDSSALLATAAPASPLARLQRARLQARLGAVGRAQYDTIARRHVRPTPLPLVLTAVAAGALWLIPARQAARPVPGTAPAAAAPVAAGVTLKVVPPAYTGVKPYETAPRDLQVPQYSTITWCGAAVELGDGSAPRGDGTCATWRATESTAWRLRGKPRNNIPERYTVRVVPDQPPVVTMTAPVEATQVLAPGASVRIAAVATDDYGVARATLHLTLARGSGENIKFSDREVPLPQSRDPRRRDWSRQWSLAELGMEPGDELYFFVRATDNSPEHPHTTQSPTFTLRLPGPEAETLESSALPSMVKPESLRSQRQIIIDTEQLVADLRANPKLPALRERSEGIAADQAHLRRRYGTFLGEESTLFGDDEHGHEEHGEHGGEEEHAPLTGSTNMAKAFGHAHDVEDNATIFDPQTKAILKRAIAAMWDAEKALRALAPAAALPPENKALAAIKELQQAERVYLHRAAFEPPAIREDKRMTGDLAGAASTKRAQGAAADLVPGDVRTLVRALSGGAPLPATWRRTAIDALGTLARDDDRLAAQRAVQDVADGCVPCRGALAAWLRGTLTQAGAVLQARPEADTPFGRAWRRKEER